jgi:hypothetical protein
MPKIVHLWACRLFGTRPAGFDETFQASSYETVPPTDSELSLGERSCSFINLDGKTIDSGSLTWPPVTG